MGNAAQDLALSFGSSPIKQGTAKERIIQVEGANLKLIRKSLWAFLSADLIPSLLLLGLVGYASTAVADSTGTFTPTGDMITSRAGHTATLLPDGRVLIAGGFAPPGFTPLASTELYDPVSGTFTLGGNMFTARGGHTATLLRDGTVLIAGGVTSRGDLTTTLEIYDLSTGTFTARGDMSSLRNVSTATILNDGTVLITGGSRLGVLGAELYDPAARTFRPILNWPAAGYNYTATLLNDGNVLSAGPGYIVLANCMEAGDCPDNVSPASSDTTAGDGCEIYDSALPGVVLLPGCDANRVYRGELYDALSGTVTHKGHLTGPSLYGYTTTLLTNGNVLLAGGGSGWTGTPHAHAALYDFSTGIFAAAGNLATARSYHTANLLQDGTVLITGGFTWVQNADSISSSAEFYDPSTGTFSSAGNLITARWRHTATLLKNGKVLIVGGSVDRFAEIIVTASAELYSPHSPPDNAP